MAENTVQQDTMTCNNAISACGMGGKWQLALDLLAKMAESTTQQDSITAALRSALVRRLLQGITFSLGITSWHRCQTHCTRVQRYGSSKLVAVRVSARLMFFEFSFDSTLEAAGNCLFDSRVAGTQGSWWT